MDEWTTAGRLKAIVFDLSSVEKVEQKFGRSRL